MPPEANTPQEPFAQIVDKLKSSNNILVTVSSDPSVDQLAACIGLTLALNKMDKHTSAVFSGKIPSTIEFLEPEKTIETNTDSLRDFIISLDKSKADKLRYKVEDEVVKIFITPYKTSISEKDLEFSQGDFNVDAVVALGVHKRSDLDAAIVAHGRILHDAAILSINTLNQNELGSIDWSNEGASSLCEMVSDVVGGLGKDTLDSQIATALLTGIVAQTDRFSNDKASPHTMSVSGTLMSAGASAQLVASKLEAVVDVQAEESDNPDDPETNPDGTISIDHEEPSTEIPQVQDSSEDSEPEDEIHIDEQGTLRPAREYMTEAPAEEKEDKADKPEPSKENLPAGSSMVLEPPQMGGQLTANSIAPDKQYSPTTDPMSTPASDSPILSHYSPPAEPFVPPTPEPDVKIPEEVPAINDTQTLSDIEQAVESAHLQNQEIADDPAQPLPPVDALRATVDQAAGLAPYEPEPIAGLNAQDVGIDLGHVPHEEGTHEQKPDVQADKPNDNLPPPVPPPMMPPTP